MRKKNRARQGVVASLSLDLNGIWIWSLPHSTVQKNNQKKRKGRGGVKMWT